MCRTVRRGLSIQLHQCKLPAPIVILIRFFLSEHAAAAVTAGGGFDLPQQVES